jgi:hypothetical protein
MGKLKLDLNGLRVDGFVTAPAGSDREGTVLANAATLLSQCSTLCTEIGSCGHICP